MLVDQAETQATEFVTQKTHIESRIVCNQGTLAHKPIKFFKDPFWLRLIPQHRISDAMNPLCLAVDRLTGIDQTMKFADNRLALHSHSTDFDNPVMASGKACRFYVHHDPTHFWFRLRFLSISLYR